MLTRFTPAIRSTAARALALATVCAGLLAASATAARPPHLFQEEECGRCHLRAARPGTFLRADAFRRDVNTLCCACHERERTGVGHRVGMHPSMRLPEDLPAGPDGRLTCATCHDPHDADGRHPHLLRREPGEAFCSACHGTERPPPGGAAISLRFPPPGAVLSTGTAVIAGTVAGPGTDEVIIRSGIDTVAAAVVRGGFAGQVRLGAGRTHITVEAGGARLRADYLTRDGGAGWTPHLASDIAQCATCHPAWESAGFFSPGPAGEGCYRCHARLDRLPSTHPPAAAGDCTVCHDPHGGADAQLSAGSWRTCVLCHEEGAASRHVIARNAGRDDGVADCTGCHDAHQSTRPGLTTSAPASLALAVDLEAPDPGDRTGPDGEALLDLPGFSATAEPGRPRLPERIVSLAVPPGADPRTARLLVLSEEQVELPGRRAVAPSPPAAAYVAGRTLTEWGGAHAVRDGRDRDVYEKDAPWPRTSLALEHPGDFRDLPFVRLAFRPLRFNPVRGSLTLARRVVAEVTFAPARGGAHPGKRGHAAHAARAAAAAGAGLANAARAASWGPSAVGALDQAGAGATASAGGSPQAAPATAAVAAADYLVVTTRVIASASGALGDFVAHKATRGLRVRVVTEDDYGAALPGPTRAFAIRQWLRDNYQALGASYALLVGDPSPETGDVPMLRAWPRRGATTNVDYLDAPTDLFYADLSGNWDLDGDGYFGEQRDDGGPGGVDFAPELSVGRIPVYGGAVGTLDAVLRKTIAYESDAGDTSWRRSVLLPMSFSDASTDGAYLAEQMRGDFLLGRGFSPWSMYQEGTAGGGRSTFPCDEELRGGAVAARWGATPFGVVAWWGHGSASRVAIGYTGAWDGDLLAAPVTLLDDAAPAFVYQVSCLNGYPEYQGNLGYALLQRGAVATVAASRVSWYYVGQKDFSSTASNAGLGYLYLARLTAGEPAGRALLAAKGDPSLSRSSDTAWMNLMDFNLYGDPSVGLFRGPLVQAAPASLAFTAAEGEQSPLTGAVALSASAGALPLDAASDAAWLAGAPAQPQAPGSVTVAAGPAGLAAGAYAAHLTLSGAQAANTPLSIPVTLTITHPAQIAGRVLSPAGAPVAGAAVALRGPRAVPAITDASGAYAFGPLPPGAYAVSVSRTGFAFSPATAAYTLAEGETWTRDFRAITMSIGGRVTTLAGAPLANVRVQLLDSSGVLLRQVLTTSRGLFTIGSLGPGSYLVRARLGVWKFAPVSTGVTLVDSSAAGLRFRGRR
jgi:predicted CXXCH cytochrome family protein